MVTVKEKLIKSGANPQLADELIKNFYIREKEDSNDSFMEYYIKQIDNKQNLLNDQMRSVASKDDIKTIRWILGFSFTAIIGLLVTIVSKMHF